MLNHLEIFFIKASIKEIVSTLSLSTCFCY